MTIVLTVVGWIVSVLALLWGAIALAAEVSVAHKVSIASAFTGIALFAGPWLALGIAANPLIWGRWRRVAIAAAVLFGLCCLCLAAATLFAMAIT